MSDTLESPTVQQLHEAAELRKLEAEARQAELTLANRKANSFESREYTLSGPINMATVGTCIGQLEQWRNIDAGAENRAMKIILNSSEGSHIHCAALHDYIRWLQNSGTEVTIEMAGQVDAPTAMVFQAASKRVMTPRSWFRLNEREGWFHANSLEGEFELEWLERLQAQSNRVITSRSQISPATLAENIRFGRTWMLRADEAKALGLTDQIAIQQLGTEFAAEPTVGAFAEGDTFEQKKKKLELRKMTADAENAELNLRNLANDGDNSFTYRFFSHVVTDTVTPAKQALRRFARRSGSEITFLINSNGGSIVDGLALYDIIQEAKEAGHKVKTVCFGYAASMGGVLLQAGHHRAMGAESWILIHRGARGFGGHMSEMKQQQEVLKRLQQECFDILASRSKLTAKQVQERCHDHDWWVTAQEALELGFIDEIL